MYFTIIFLPYQIKIITIYKMDIKNIAELKNRLITDCLKGSDSSVTNVFLLMPKYNTELFLGNDYFLRYYHGLPNRTGYAFPLPLKDLKKPDGSSPDQSVYLKNAFLHILESRKDSPVDFCLFTLNQKNTFDNFLKENFPSYKVNWDSLRDDSDYIYLQKNLAELPGPVLHKKKNHVSKFLRTYEGKWEYKPFPEEDIADDFLLIEEKWFNERSNDVEKAFDKESLLLEKESIKYAIENHELFGLSGGIIYIEGEPAAMCLASPISDDTLDVHFEKVLSQYAQNGGYPAINNFFAKSKSDYLYFNREEDVGVEGLRKAKLSYKPEILLDKYFGRLEKC